MHTTEFKLNDISITVQRKKVTRMRLVLYPETGRVRISAPPQTPDHEIRTFAVSHFEWIQTQLAKTPQKGASTAYPDIKRAKSIYLNGELIPIEIRKNAIKATSRRNKTGVVFSLPRNASAETRQKAVERFYKKELKATIESILPKWESAMGEHISKISYRTMKTRWGSCTPSSAQVRLNIRLAMMPVECQVQVLVHELVHFKVHNHGVQFKKRMTRFLPEWQQYKKRLKEYDRIVGTFNTQSVIASESP